MPQTDYLVRIGAKFDIDRGGDKELTGWLESIAGARNAMLTKKASEGINQRNKLLEDNAKDLEKANKDAEKVREKAVGESADRIKTQLQKGMPVKAKRDKETDEFIDEKAGEKFVKDMKKISSAYDKFADKAAKRNLKTGKAAKYGGEMGGFGTGTTTKTFMANEIEDRARIINLVEEEIQSNDKLIKRKRGGHLQAAKDNDVLKEMKRDMISADKEAFQLEKKEANTKRQNFNDYKKRQKEQLRGNKLELRNIKIRTEAYRKMGKQVQGYANSLGSGMKNAFVIGTAAAAAFAYKLQPVIEQVTQFERTIINANSVFNVSRKELHSVTDEMVRFGLQYGVSTQDAATGLYQLASAGLSAAESQEVLRHTLLLSMATQGDHNTLAKLTVQTIMGFGMEMSQAGELTDKFAHTIQKSLVEWQDLASSVKFAMPFFVATGQSIDQLLGGIEVLSNRALEAGIAGRGLRQALAQIAKHADDNADALKSMGVETMNADGTMRDLTDIAQQASEAFEGQYTDVESLTAMLESFNVRGATAFALLAQNADEFTAAVDNLAESSGEATAMADIQQQSLEAQIQRVKTALIAPFLFSDKVGEANNTLNSFTLAIKELVDEMVGFFIVGEEGNEKLTDFSYAIRDFVLEVMKELIVVVRRLKDVFLEQKEGLNVFTKLMHLSVKPMLFMLDILDALGPNLINFIVYYKIVNKLLPISTFLQILNTKAMLAMSLAQGTAKAQKAGYLGMIIGETAALKIQESVLYQNAAAWTVNWAAMTAGIILVVVAVAAIVKMFEPMRALIAILVGATVAWIAFHSAWSVGVAAIAIVAGMVVALGALRLATGEWGLKKNSSVMDNGGMFIPQTYDNGGPPTSEHGMAILQSGETVVPRTQNMLGGGGGDGITINISGDVYDGENFANKIAEVLPQALNSASADGSLDIRTFGQGASFDSSVQDRAIYMAGMSQRTALKGMDK